jgi:hypothetical protein
MMQQQRREANRQGDKLTTHGKGRTDRLAGRQAGRAGRHAAAAGRGGGGRTRSSVEAHAATGGSKTRWV